MEGEDRLIAAVAQRLTRIDAVGRRLGIQLEELGPGRARLAMTVAQEMVGGHGICHGAYTFALADTACGYACASRNVQGLSQGGDLMYVAPARLGDRLVAEATEAVVAGRNAVYDVHVRNQEGATVAILRARCRILDGSLVPT